MTQWCIDRVILPTNIAYPHLISLIVKDRYRISEQTLTCRIIITNGKDRGNTTIATWLISQIRLPTWTAVQYCMLAGRGAVVGIAADRGCIPPHHLAVVAPAFEPGGVFVAVREGVVFDFAVVEEIGEQG